jgi:hypothetical protein
MSVVIEGDLMETGAGVRLQV